MHIRLFNLGLVTCLTQNNQTTISLDLQLNPKMNLVKSKNNL